MNRPYRYPWPASQLSPADMKLLHCAREARPGRPPITRLIAEAVRAAYGAAAIQPDPSDAAEESAVRPAA